MKIETTSLPGVLLISPKIFGDDRGFFLETFQEERYREAGIAGPFVQDNLSRSAGGVLRGLHLQHPRAQGKLVYALEGEVFDVTVDVRVGSPNFGKWFGAYLSATDKRQLYVPPGFAHGFCTLSESVFFAYKCSHHTYHPEDEMSIRWDDPAIGIEWPIDNPMLSTKDAAGTRLADISPQALPAYSGTDGR